MIIDLYKASGLPVFQNKTYATRDQALSCKRGDVRIVQNLDSGLIYNDAFDPDAIQYDDEYQNEQAHSAVFRDHLHGVINIIERTIGRRKLIEVGCGKGYFVDMLADAGFDVIGIDAAYEGDNPRVIKALFGPSLSFHAEGIVLRHVLEHVKDPVSFLRDIAKANGSQGLIYIEVPCFDWILRHNAWFDIFYEHVNYFRLSDFDRMFCRVLESGRAFGDQYLYVVADLSSLREPNAGDADAIQLPPGFGPRFKEVDHNGRSVIWGASSKGVIYCVEAVRHIASAPDFAIDINPVKQGRYLPATGLEIKSPRDGVAALEGGDTIIIMNSNYRDEIAAQAGPRFRYESIDNEQL